MEQKTQDIIDYFSLDVPKGVVELRKKAEVVAPAVTGQIASSFGFREVLIVGLATASAAAFAIPIFL